LSRRSTRVALLVLAITACGEAPVIDRVVEPRGRVHPGTHEPGQDSVAEPGDAPDTGTSSSGRDPKIDQALELVRTSKLRFLAPDPDDAANPDEYTAEQFASMLESKRDWIGYDITQFDPWLDDIATSSFLDRVPYLVMLDDGTTRELRPWLVERMAGP
jgi:hypothetical protein